MKKLITLALLFWCVGISEASFKENRDTIGKSSYTAVEAFNARISSAPSFVRWITFSGVNPTTVSIYDTQIFTVNTTTKSKVYWPGGQIAPVTVDVDCRNSSGTMITKEGLGDANFNWDWEQKPNYSNALNERN